MEYKSNLGYFSLNPTDYYSQSRSEMLQFIPAHTKYLLDVGCGEGNFASQLTKTGKNVWGIELNEKAALIAASKLDKVLTGDINSQMEFLPDNYFDCIIFNDILEHLADPYQLLSDIKSKLSPGGLIVASIPNVRYITNIKKLLIDKQWKYEDAGILDKTHLRFFTKKSLIDMFDSLGYELIVIEGINPIKTRLFILLNILSFGWLNDTKYLQFACVAKPE